MSDGGEHVCRLFGRFVCRTPSCRGKAWTSAYVWRYSERPSPVCEKQGCRTCGRETEPEEWRPRAGDRFGGNIDGRHDVAHCGRCQKLGRDCSQMFR